MKQQSKGQRKPLRKHAAQAGTAARADGSSEAAAFLQAAHHAEYYLKTISGL